ncbi:MAG: L-threonylcarbamoyladenylate synthase [Pseudomonadota bacterium]
MPATRRFSQDQIDAAAALLRAGGLVAFPTETVYGLGADATDDLAVARIYQAKGRPSFNPLIAHVPDVAKAREIAVFSPEAEALAAAFWPGALTLVLPLRTDAQISKLVTAGLDTVALRVPQHPLAQQLLSAVGRPVAAPSANPSGRISPTAPDHVLAGLDGAIDGVVLGGACPVGLESTIVGLAPAPTLLRPGGVATGDIEEVIGIGLSTPGAEITAPGQLASHYAPGAPLRMNATEPRAGEVYLGFGPGAATVNLSPSGDLVEAAANLFGHLHKLDQMGAPIAVAPVPETGLGQAINDRLRRAAAPRT